MTLGEALVAIRDADAALAQVAPLPFPLPVGRLAPLVAGAVSALERGDWWVPSLRERVGAVLRGVPVERLADGLAGAMPYRVAPAGGSPALRALMAVGLARTNPEGITLVHLGIGSMADGACHEAFNLAALLQARVIFLVAIDPLGVGAPIGRQLAATPTGLAAAFGIPATEIDGNDAAAVHAAVTATRNSQGPQLIAASLARPEENPT